MPAETDELLKQKLVEYMGSLESAVKSAGDVVVDEFPKVVEEYLRWVAVINGIGAVVSGLVLMAFVMLFITLWRKLPVDEQPKLMLFIVPFVLLPVFLFGCSYKLIKVTVAPRVLMLEKIADMVD
mgnify:CR=1 FL=1